MGGPVILEVTDGRGRVHLRTRIPAEGLTVGRGYGNDVILDDPYVEAAHLRIVPVADGRIEVQDLDTVNGTWLWHRTERISTAALQAGSAIRIGRTVLRVVAADQPVPAALRDGGGSPARGSPLDSPVRVVAIVAIAILVPLVTRFYASTEDESLSQLATPGVASLILAGIWAAGWAFTNRIVAQRFRFLAHFGWAAAIATFFLVVTALFEWLGFFVPGLDWSTWEAVASVGLGALLLAGHFGLLTEWPTGRRWGIALAATIAIGTVFSLLGDGEQSESELFQVTALKPVATRWVRSTPVDDFFERVEKSRSRGVEEPGDR